ncbi:class II glutamine amidotransferase [Corynebacterium efficiens YS-314]|uniref:Glutamate synthase large subunit n=1 Tax=Corynebacterium efficiens (strain DSM 44549 / YS-314 / AJ 12310 / JCM 11189 / NBRC 100395) TaxID=196164 RepID=Q8FU63_COREF|nr:glutamate synthase large subunit [Corynebacterium efficiens]EEW48794.1 class II glutamine amidotransferase [Corynebacterium efficiens YS-314]BAC16968.1 glutamate synthase large subunit [Corynebacterium efficiens YS-314]
MKKQGLYNPAFEHDSCGVAFVADIHGRASRRIISNALEALCRMEHRGAAGAEKTTGDGAGILLQIPDALYRADTDFDLPEPGHYATGIAFLPRARMAMLDAQKEIARIATEEGATVLGWREVRVDPRGIGEMAAEAMPSFSQLFLTVPGTSGTELDRVMFFIRKRCERELGTTGDRPTVYFPSLSARTVIYKGMLTTAQLERFYRDLQDPRMESAIAVVHSRFSTNTFPSWPLAHPYRLVAHNGEINTVRGNENWMRAREALIDSHVLGPLNRVLPVCTPGGSDTALFDEALELLHLGGYELPHAVAMMIPQPWEHSTSMNQELRDFYEYHSCLMEPWDGPAALAFTDGRYVGAVLDRNGLRPGRIAITSDGLVVMASESGVLDLDESSVVKRTRLVPGQMFLVDTAQGRVIPDDEVKRGLQASAPYGEWIRENFVHLSGLPRTRYEYMPHQRAVLRQRVFGITEEDVDLLILPMARTGAEAIGSMGSDTPIAAISQRPRMLYDFFAQRFAQVTNPPLDSIREKPVTSMYTLLGAQSDVLNPGPEAARRIRLESPVIDNHELATLIHANDHGEWDTFGAAVISGLYPVAHHGAGMKAAIARVRREVSEAIRQGSTLIVLSDRESNEQLAPIPALLLTSAVHQYLVQQRTRTRCSLVVESGDAREIHHLAMLISFGADAINPYMAFETIDELRMKGQLGDLDLDEACRNYVTAATTGVLKVMSKMGIATVSSYRGAQLADVTGLHQDLLDDYFGGIPSPISGIGLDEVAADVEARHRSAFLPRPEEHAHRELDLGGEYKWRREGEYHLFNPETIFKLQHATRTGQYAIFKDYTAKVDGQSARLGTIRGLFEFSTDRQPIPVEEVEPVSSIVRRFSTGAMSYGSISAEAHEVLAIAMNRLGGMSNSGEGGEDARRFTPEPNGDWKRSAIKQVASGRFGVTSHYLNNCTDIQIKMAQGAKPGEGGQLPPEKVYPWIAEVRITTPGVGLISPPPHHDIYSIEDLAQLIHDLKNANPDARIHVKLVAEQGVGTVAAGVSKAHADVVLISGHDGGTGASPLTSLKHAGGPWELGLAETQQTLLLNGLRDRIRVQCDGQLKTGRDVMIAALLGAEEFGFATAPLVVEGCIMMRVCHLDTCPVGIATQNPDLRAKFTGQAEHVVNFFTFIAQEVREYLAQLGFRTLDEAVGQSQVLRKRADIPADSRAAHLDLTPIFHRPVAPHFPEQDIRCTTTQDHDLEAALDNRFIEQAADTIARAAAGEQARTTLTARVSNVNRSVGTMLGSVLTRAAGASGLDDDTITLNLTGCAGNSFGAFIPAGITLTLTGDANDFVGKGLSGGRIIIRPSERAPKQLKNSPDIIAGNVLGYGATSGEMFIRGEVGERFCVRNSGATAVVEGIGNHGCEYMTGGRVLVLGPVGENFGAGMSGGIAYLLDEPDLEKKINRGLVDVEKLTPDEALWADRLIARHVALTGSTTTVRAKDLVKVMPRDYKRVLLSTLTLEEAH